MWALLNSRLKMSFALVYVRLGWNVSKANQESGKNVAGEVRAGIDYSLTSPAICIGEEGSSFEDCFLYGFAPTKKLVGTYGNIELLEYPDWSCNSHRYDLLSNWVLDKLSYHNVSTVILEGYSYGSKGRAVINIGEAGGLLRWKFWKNDITLIEIAPSQLKKTVTGKGNADKGKMWEEFYKTTNVNLLKEFQPKKKDIGNPTSDLVDAYWLWKTG